MSSQRTYTEEEKMKYVAEFKASGMSMQCQQLKKNIE